MTSAYWLRGIGLAGLLAALALATFGAAPAAAATLTVTTTTDRDDGDYTPGNASLREAVKYAGSGDTVTFSGNGTYTLTLGQIVIDKDLIIDGLDGATHGDTVISGNNAGRVFNITSGQVAIKDLTVTAGQPASEENGGGILNDATLGLYNVVVSNCTVTNAQGGGIYCGEATLNLTGCVITGNTAQGNASSYDIRGGGIYCEGDVGSAVLNMTDTVVSLNQAGEQGGGVCAMWTDAAITRCTFDQNQSDTDQGYDGGGAIHAYETEADITDCEFSQNSSYGGGGGISARHYSTLNISGSTFYHNYSPIGGALSLSDNCLLTASDSTFSDNTSDKHGGALFINDLATGSPVSSLSFVTITNNTADADCEGGGDCNNGDGGGLFLAMGTLKFKGVIVAGNTDSSLDEHYNDVVNHAGDLQSGGNNLIGDWTGSSTTFPAGTPNLNDDYVGTAASPLTGVVQGIADNGGPTRTCALSPGSLAINHGPPDCADAAGNPVATDQRGLGRSRGGCPDIGAYETPAGGTPLAMLLE